MSDEKLPSVGGEGGGAEKLVLKRSELIILRKMADRYGVVDGERREMAEVALSTMRGTKSPRTKLQAINTLATLDGLALRELDIATSSQKKESSGPGVVQVNIQINEQVESKQIVIAQTQSIPTIAEEVVQSNGTANHPKDV